MVPADDTPALSKRPKNDESAQAARDAQAANDAAAVTSSDDADALRKAYQERSPFFRSMRRQAAARAAASKK